MTSHEKKVSAIARAGSIAGFGKKISSVADIKATSNEMVIGTASAKTWYLFIFIPP